MRPAAVRVIAYAAGCLLDRLARVIDTDAEDYDTEAIVEEAATTAGTTSRALLDLLTEGVS